MKNKGINPILIILAATLLILCIGVMLYLGKKEEQVQSARMEALKEEAKPYEKEIEQIQNELKSAQENIEETTNQAEVMILLQVRNTEELQKAEEWLKGYSFPVTVVLDVTVPEEEIRSLLEAISHSVGFSENGTDIMVTGNALETGTMDSALQWDTICTGYSLDFSDWCFLGEGQDNRENIELLKQNGFVGFCQMTDYGINLKSGEDSSGLIYTEYVPVFTGDNKIESTLELCADQRKAVAFSFDVASIIGMDAAEVDTLIENTLILVQTMEENQKLTVHNANQIIQQKELNKKSLEEKQAEYDQRAVEQQEKIAELRSKTREIYSRWEE